MNDTVEGWVVDVDSTPACLKLGWFEGGQMWARAEVYWNGCIDYERASGVPFPETPENCIDRLHICSAKTLVRQMLGIIHEAQAHFGGDRN